MINNKLIKIDELKQELNSLRPLGKEQLEKSLRKKFLFPVNSYVLFQALPPAIPQPARLSHF
ncbi:MAG: hypothetical protein PHC64_02865 [Candidatus Gastranaerophilales bacterium]|nr:hypothetical protein [Candidatus Gastranaerophilales bacterium]